MPLDRFSEQVCRLSKLPRHLNHTAGDQIPQRDALKFGVIIPLHQDRPDAQGAGVSVNGGNLASDSAAPGIRFCFPQPHAVGLEAILGPLPGQSQLLPEEFLRLRGPLADKKNQGKEYGGAGYC